MEQPCCLWPGGRQLIGRGGIRDEPNSPHWEGALSGCQAASLTPPAMPASAKGAGECLFTISNATAHQRGLFEYTAITGQDDVSVESTKQSVPIKCLLLIQPFSEGEGIGGTTMRAC